MTMIINVPRALISGLIEILSIDRIWVGMVSTPGGRQNMLAVMLSNEMVKTSRRLATMAGISSGSATSRKVCSRLAPSDSAASS